MQKYAVASKIPRLYFLLIPVLWIEPLNQGKENLAVQQRICGQVL